MSNPKRYKPPLPLRPVAPVASDLPLGIPKGDAWLVQESDASGYKHLQCAN